MLEHFLRPSGMRATPEMLGSVFANAAIIYAFVGESSPHTFMRDSGVVPSADYASELVAFVLSPLDVAATEAFPHAAAEIRLSMLRYTRDNWAEITRSLLGGDEGRDTQAGYAGTDSIERGLGKRMDEYKHLAPETATGQARIAYAACRHITGDREPAIIGYLEELYGGALRRFTESAREYELVG